MTYEEFLARANEIQVLDKDLWRQMRSLYVDRGTLQQVVRAIQQFKTDILEQMSNRQMISDEHVRIAIGLQGQVLGINNILALLHGMMQEPPADDEPADGDDNAKVP